MQTEFFTFFQLGFEHICSLLGSDHIVFVLVLCAIYRLEDWRKIILPITGFTIGHSITLALSALNIVHLPEQWIETLIPITILIAAIGNVKQTYRQPIARKEGDPVEQTLSPNVSFGWVGGKALFFGLIHGLGFSYYFKAMLGENESIIFPLLSFNIGLEIGQLLIIACILGIYAIFTRYFKVRHHDWVVLISGIGMGVAAKILLG